MVLNGDTEPGDKVRVDADGDRLTFDVDKGAASQEVSDLVRGVGGGTDAGAHGSPVNRHS